MGEYRFQAIGTVRSCFKEKFGIPRQAGLAPAAESVIELDPRHASLDLGEALRGLEGFTHVWVVFVFHDLDHELQKPLIRPPRLGGKEKVGIFASRSPHRPNPIGISAVKLDRIELGEIPRIFLSGADLVDGTPVLDIKPYIPYADSIANAGSGWLTAEMPQVAVRFSAEALAALETSRARKLPRLRTVIEQMLRLDPRPAHQRDRRDTDPAQAEARTQYAARLYDFDVHWHFVTEPAGECCVVTEIQAL